MMRINFLYIAQFRNENKYFQSTSRNVYFRIIYSMISGASHVLHSRHLCIYTRPYLLIFIISIIFLNKIIDDKMD